uniref:Secreted protein n=1 Tax=Ixodes scapularis TaxID=6945 RepID=A0A4D5RX25_IXOSC
MFNFFFSFFFLCVYPVLNHFLCSNWMASLDAFCAQQSTRTLAFNNSCRLHSSIRMHQEVKWHHLWPICFGPGGTLLFDVGILSTPLHSGCNWCVALAGHFADAAAFHWQFFFHRRCLHLSHQKPLFLHVVLAVGILFLCSRVAS